MPLMLDILRQHSKSFLIYVFFGIIIVVFVVNFGPGSECGGTKGGGGDTLAAEVNGKRIAITEFENIYNHDPRFAQFRDRKDDTAELRKSAMDQLVEREVLAQEAKRMGIEISDEDLGRRIRRIPWLQKDGKFSLEFYTRIVNGWMNSSVPAFEARLRKDFLGDSLRGVLIASINVGDTEVDNEWKTRNTKVDVEYLSFDAEGDKKAAVVTKEEALAWKAANKKKLEDHWTSKRFLYFARKEYKLRQIALKLPGQDAAVKVPVKKRADEIKKELDAGKDFAELAKAYSQDEKTKASGGDMGLVERKDMPSIDFKKHATETQVGKISPVFCDTEFCRVVKVESTREKELKDLEDEIAEDLLKEEKVSAGAKLKAEAVIASLRANPAAELKSFAPVKAKKVLTPEEQKKKDEKAAAKKKQREALKKMFEKNPGMKAELPPDTEDEAEKGPHGTTGEFAKARNFLVPGLGISKDLMKAAWSLKKKGDVAPAPIQVDKKLYVIRLAKEPAAAKASDDDLQTIRRELLTMKQIRLYETWLDELRKGAKVAVNRAVLKPPAVRKKGDEKEDSAPKEKDKDVKKKS